MTGPRTRVLQAATLLVVTGLTGFTGAAPAPAEVGDPTDSQVTAHGEDESDGNKVMVDTRGGHAHVRADCRRASAAAVR